VLASGFWTGVMPESNDKGWRDVFIGQEFAGSLRISMKPLSCEPEKILAK